MDEKEIKKLFSELPPIEDHRSKETILARLKEDERLQQPKKRKKIVKKLPGIAALAAILLMSLLLPTILKGKHGGTEQSLEQPAFKMMDRDDASLGVQDEVESDFENEEESAVIEAADFSGYEGNVLLADELSDSKIFRIGLVSNANVIPISFIIQEKQIHADFQGEPNSVQLYNQYAAHISEEALGFDAYHPYEGKVKVEKESVTHWLPSGHPYDFSSAAIDVYEKTVRATFQDLTNWQVVDEHGNQVAFNQVGMMAPIQLTAKKNIQSIYKQEIPSGQSYLIAVPDAPIYETLDQALLGMKERPNDLVEQVVPEKVAYSIKIEQDTASIIFQEPMDLLEMSYEDALAMIEGFMLTAESADMKVKLENVKQESFGRYNLMKPLPLPIASNPIDLVLD